MHGWYAAARVAGAKGLEGKLRLDHASAFLRSASFGVTAALVPPSADAPRFVTVREIDQTGEDACLVRFAEVGSADLAQLLQGKRVLLEGEASVSIDDEVGLQWLVGFTVEDPSLGIVGTVDAVDDSPSRFQPLMQVRRGSEEALVLIPLVEELIVSVDEDQGRIVMKLPQGILEL